MHAGALPYKNKDGYREVSPRVEEVAGRILTRDQEINHAGYHRYILGRNARRYNGFGDELEDGVTDEDWDSDAVEENAYGDIRLEGVLGPFLGRASAC